MPQKRKTRSRSKKKTSGKKGTRKISGANGAIEPSSGSESSSLDLKRKAISVPDEYRVPVTSGQLSGDAQGFPKRTSMTRKASKSWWKKDRIWQENCPVGCENAAKVGQRT